VRAPVYNAGVRQKTGLLLTERFTEAMTLAARLHGPQWRKGTGIPYVSHLLGVTSIAIDYGANEDEAIAALLHDAIEDAPADLGADWVRRTIRHRFGANVLRIVEGCTDSDVRPKPPWRQRKEAYLRHIVRTSRSIALV
jgi:GTP pyrophosphokinase